MKIPSVNSLFQSLTVTRSSATISQWQTGQQLQATVLSRLDNGLVSLRVGATILTAQLDFQVKIGEKLALEVLTPGDKPVLQSLRNDQLKQLIDAAIRQTLPKQQSIAQLAKDIESLLSQKQLNRLPDSIQAALKQLIRSFPDKNLITQENGIKQAFRQSGLFLEARLSGLEKSQALNLNFDIKAGLLRLQAVIQQHLSQSATSSSSPLSSNPYQQTPSGQALTGAPAAVAQNQLFQATQTFTALGTPLNGIRLPAAPITTGNHGQQHSGTTGTTQTPAATTPATTLDARILSSQAHVNTNTATLPAGILDARNLLTTLSQGALTSTNMASAMRSIDPATAFVYPGMPFRLQSEQQDTRPSVRFSRLDSLTKILTLFLKETDASLARIQQNQLSHHQVESDQKQSWLFEIPVKHRDSIDVFKFRLEKDASSNHAGNDEEESGWTINISFYIEALGQIYSKVNVHQKKVSVIFWAEQQHTADNFLQHMQSLQHDLENAGLIVAHINCLQGKPPESKNTPSASGVVNEQA